MWKRYLFNKGGHSKYFGKARFVMPEENGTGDLENVSVSAGGSSENDQGSDDDGELDGEADKADLIKKLAEMTAEVNRLNNTKDKLLKEKKNLENERRAKLSAEELAKEAKEARDKEFDEMKRELRISKYSKRLVGVGMAEADADAFAGTIPEMEDPDTFFDTLGKFVKAREKAAGEKAIQDLLKNRPDIHAGNGESDKDDSAMALAKRQVEQAKANVSASSSEILKSYM